MSSTVTFETKGHHEDGIYVHAECARPLHGVSKNPPCGIHFRSMHSSATCWKLSPVQPQAAPPTERHFGVRWDRGHRHEAHVRLAPCRELSLVTRRLAYLGPSHGSDRRFDIDRPKISKSHPCSDFGSLEGRDYHHPNTSPVDVHREMNLSLSFPNAILPYPCLYPHPKLGPT